MFDNDLLKYSVLVISCVVYAMLTAYIDFLPLWSIPLVWIIIATIVFEMFQDPE